MSNAFIDIHVLQTVPPSNINRDDTGSPKTAKFGGVTRARVSSQAWKAACRKDFPSVLDAERIGVRTKNLVAYVAGFIRELAPDASEEDLASYASAALSAAKIKVDKDGKTGALFFMSPLQARGLAELAVESYKSGEKIKPTDAKGILDVRAAPELNAIDIALFGRMVADSPDLNVDAAVQVAHALGVSSSQLEFDYYTAMDDRSPEDSAGAGMIGTVEFMSSTLYRYASLDFPHLVSNLGDGEVAAEAARAFLRTFVTSMPTGKQNTFGNRTLPGFIIIQVRDSQPVSLVGAFEKPIYPRDDSSVIALATNALVKQEGVFEAAYGVEPVASYIVSALGQDYDFGETTTLEEAVDSAIASAQKTFLAGEE